MAGLEYPFLLFVVGSIIWVGVDHRGMDRDYGREPGDSSTAFWVIACILVWIVAFPWYLFARRARIREAEQVIEWEAEEADDARLGQPPTGAFCGACGALQALPGDQFCRGCGASLSAD